MNIPATNLSCEVELRSGEKLILPEEIINSIGAGRWKISIVPVTPNTDTVRQHTAFLNSYAPEDEGLYDDYSAR
jgi:hypothetical protein